MLTSVVRKGCVALHYSVHFFFYEFSLSRNDRNRGGGYRRKICTVPAPFFVSTRPAREYEGFELRAMCMDTAGSPPQPYKILHGCGGEPAVSTHMALSSNPSYSRAGRADTKNGAGTVQILRRYPPPRLRSLREREKS